MIYVVKLCLGTWKWTLICTTNVREKTMTSCDQRKPREKLRTTSGNPSSTPPWPQASMLTPYEQPMHCPYSLHNNHNIQNVSTTNRSLLSPFTSSSAFKCSRFFNLPFPNHSLRQNGGKKGGAACSPLLGIIWNVKKKIRLPFPSLPFKYFCTVSPLDRESMNETHRQYLLFFRNFKRPFSSC